VFQIGEHAWRGAAISPVFMGFHLGNRQIFSRSLIKSHPAGTVVSVNSKRGQVKIEENSLQFPRFDGICNGRERIKPLQLTDPPGFDCFLERGAVTAFCPKPSFYAVFFEVYRVKRRLDSSAISVGKDHDPFNMKMIDGIIDSGSNRGLFGTAKVAYVSQYKKFPGADRKYFLRDYPAVGTAYYKRMRMLSIAKIPIETPVCIIEELSVAINQIVQKSHPPRAFFVHRGNYTNP
jgi:hypothetical protein